MAQPLFLEGDRVCVVWMGELVEGVVWQVKLRGYHGRVLVQPRYALEIEGAIGRPWYEQNEIAGWNFGGVSAPPSSNEGAVTSLLAPNPGSCHSPAGSPLVQSEPGASRSQGAVGMPPLRRLSQSAPRK